MESPQFSRSYFSLLGVIVLSTLIGCGSVGGQLTGSQTSSASLAFGHVFVIMMENKEYDDVIGSSQAPYINKLARTYASASSYYAIRHPSLPNYLALVSGSTQGVTDDCPDCSYDAPNLADQLDAHHKSWRSYAEDIPGPCFNGPFGDTKSPQGKPLYARKHNPLMYFKDISGNSQRCNQVVPLSQFAGDLQKNQLPDFASIAPNIIHDMHDGSVRDGDDWLASFVPQILDSPAWKTDGVLFILWDEGSSDDGCCGSATGGHTIALVIAANGKRAYQSKVQYTHYSVLRTIEEVWQLGFLGNAGADETRSMMEFVQ
jgi:hypothetical protein